MSKTILRLELPAEAAKKLLEGFKNKDPQLMKILEEFKIEDIQEKTMPRPEAEIIKDIQSIHYALSPENLHCDGEISNAEANRKARKLNAELAVLRKELGRDETDKEIYG